MKGSTTWPVTPGVHCLPDSLIEPLVHWAQEAGLPFKAIDLSRAQDKAEVMACLARGLSLPEYFGANLDALHDSLIDPDFAPRGVLLLCGLHDVPGLPAAALVEVFEEAAQAHGGAGTARVYWSIRVPAPR
jgi:RNAse (barnase) inhibitor barstar